MNYLFKGGFCGAAYSYPKFDLPTSSKLLLLANGGRLDVFTLPLDHLGRIVWNSSLDRVVRFQSDLKRAKRMSDRSIQAVTELTHFRLPNSNTASVLLASVDPHDQSVQHQRDEASLHETSKEMN